MLESTIEYNGVTFNDQSLRNYDTPPYYWFRVTSVDGIWDEDVRFEVHDKPHQHGTASGDAYYSGKTVVISGEIRAKDLGALRQAQRTLQAAFYDMQQHQLLFTLWGEERVYLTCRKNQKIDMPERQDRGGSNPWVRPFTVQLYADDPRLYREGTSTPYPVWQ